MFITRETTGPYARDLVEDLAPAETMAEALKAFREWATSHKYTIATIDEDEAYPGLAADAAIYRASQMRLFTIEEEALTASLAAE